MRFILVLLLIFITGCSSKWEARNDRTTVYMGSPLMGFVSIRSDVKPYEEVKFRKVVRQKLDYSCGSATAATIMNFYLQQPVTEDYVIKKLFEVGDVKKIIKRRGFSLLDLKRFFEAHGYKALGVKTNVETLASLGKPAIVTIVIGKYKHYVVFRGVYKGRVILADPAFGTTVLSVKDFERMWYKNIALIIDDKPIDKTNLAFSKDELFFVSDDFLRKDVIYYSLPIYRTDRDF